MTIRQFFLPEFIKKFGPVKGYDEFDRFCKDTGISPDEDYLSMEAADKAALILFSRNLLA